MAEGGEPAPRRKGRKDQGQEALVAAATAMEAKAIEALLAEVTDQSPLVKLLNMQAVGDPEDLDAVADSFLVGEGDADGEGVVMDGATADAAATNVPPPTPGQLDAAAAVAAVQAAAAKAAAAAAAGSTGAPEQLEGASNGEAAAAVNVPQLAEGLATFQVESSEGYNALLQLLRAKTPAELLKASSRLCAHVADTGDGGGGEGGAGAAGGAKEANEAKESKKKAAAPAAVAPAPTPGARMAATIRKECNEILLSNGTCVDLEALLNSPGRVIQISTAKRQKRDPADWAKTSAETMGEVELVGTSHGGALAAAAAAVAEAKASKAGGSASTAAAGSSSSADGPSLKRMSSAAKGGLKRPAGLALGELEVPAAPQGAPPSALGEDDLPIDAMDVPLVDVASALSPLLASTFGLAPESMRSFLRIDDLTFDLLSPLGTGRPGSQLKEGTTFPAPQ